MIGPKLADGRTAELFAWGENRVVKLYRNGFPPAEAEAEEEKIRLVCAAGVQTPAALDLVQVDGRFGLVQERVDGPMMWTVIQEQPWRLRPMARLLAELQAALHEHTAPADLPSRRARLRRQISHIEEMPDAVKTAVLSALDHLPDGDSICHGDFHPGNVLLTADGPVVIDWVDVARGDPLADVGRTALLAKTVEPEGGAALRLLIRGMLRLFGRIYLKRYGEIRPFAPRALTAWEGPLAAARLSEGLSPTENERLIAVVKSHFRTSPI